MARNSQPWGAVPRKRESQFTEKREAVFDTAARLFREQGFDSASLHELAELLNITKPTVYYYVKSKDDLLYQIKCMAQERVVEMFEEAAALAGNGYERLRHAMIAYAAFMTTDYGVCLSIVPARHMERANLDLFYKGVTKTNKMLTQMIETGVADGSLVASDHSLVIRTLFGSLNWTGMWYKPGVGLTPEKLAEKQVDILLNGIRGRSG